MNIQGRGYGNLKLRASIIRRVASRHPAFAGQFKRGVAKISRGDANPTTAPSFLTKPAITPSLTAMLLGVLLGVLSSPTSAARSEAARASDAEMKTLDIQGDKFHPEWNYTIRPRSAANRSS
jgi:hypothetical protein